MTIIMTTTGKRLKETLAKVHLPHDFIGKIPEKYQIYWSHLTGMILR